MNSGIYAACAGLMTRMQSLDNIASNVANSSSTGFRGQTASFGTTLAEAAHHGNLSSLNQTANSFSQMTSTQLDQTQGVLSRTGNDLDVAVQGSGYFKVLTATGTAYTRNGNFQLDTAGKLVTASGDAVMGEGGPIMLDKGPVSISGDGTITQNGAITGKLAVVTFKPGTNMQQRGIAYYTAPPNTEQKAVGASVQQGALEGSNVSPIDGMVQLISAQRAAESMRHVLTLIDTDMNKTAVDLAHVG
ncbi:MAG: flagellar basal-body rod protein FlgF [Janthinobacterium lividum]